MKLPAYFLILLGISFIMVKLLIDLLLPIGVVLLVLGIAFLIAEQAGYSPIKRKRIKD